jgi:hypothetical protein
VKKILISLAVTALAAALLASAALSAKPKTIVFAGSYTGNATTQMNGNSGTVTANGSGNGTMIGSSKLSGSGPVTQQQPCALFSGPGTIVAANGAKIVFTVKPGAQGCGSDSDNTVTISGYAAVNGGSGKFAKAKGTLKFTGVYDRGGGAFNVKFAGKLTV